MKKVLIGAIVGAFFLAGVSLYLMFRPTPVPDQMSGNGQNIPSKENVKEAEPEPFSGVDSMFNLLNRGGAYECSFSFDVDSGVPTVAEGTFFIKGNLLRSDNVTKVGDMEVVTSTILRDGYVYSWSAFGGTVQGIKVKADPVTQADIEANNQQVPPKEMEALKQQINYDCKPWVVVDNSIFELPSDVLFKDFEEIMNVGMEYGSTFEASADQCAACSYLTGDAKAQCLAALSCE